MLFLNDPPCFIPEKYAADMKTDFNPYNFADPGNNDSRQKTEKNAVDVRKGIVGIPKTLQRISKKRLTAKAP